MSRHHKFDFIEIPVTDVARAKAFYGTVFGWTFVDYGPDYADIREAGVSGGLSGQKEPPTRGGTLAVVYSDNLPESEKAVTSAGGKVIAHHEFPGGRRFQFLDPDGNELAVWTSTTE